MRPTVATAALLASLSAAAAQDRFPILQPDQMNAEQKTLLETLVSGPRAAELRRRPGNPRAQERPVQCVDAQPRVGHEAAGGRRADPLQLLDPAAPQ